MTQNPIICALDTVDTAEAIRLAESLKAHIGAIKLGLEFFTARGPEGVKALSSLGIPIFLDLKFHDIPNTVAGAVRAAVALDVFMLTIHAGSSFAMMQAAAKAAEETAEALGKKRPLIIGVTVLTSMEKEDMAEVGIAGTVESQVVRVAKLAKAAGLDGAVCSPHEIALLKAECGQDFKLIVPGIRLEASPADDQKRTLSPAEALKFGADYLVIGRPITKAEEPAEAAKAISNALKAA